MCRSILGLAVVAMLAVVTGCSDKTSTQTSSNATNENISVDSSEYLLTEEPQGFQDVIAARESAKDEDEVVILGRIGGTSNPWIEDRAAFWIVDSSLKACNDIPGDSCSKPWDYCCETDDLPAATVLVKVVDEDGELLKCELRQLLSVKELSTVIVKGTARRDESGNLQILAHGVYVRG